MHCQLMPCDESESTRHGFHPHGSVLMVRITLRTASLPAALPARQSEAWGLQGHKQVGGALFSLDIGTGEAELLLDNWNGLRFNSPNDLAVCNCVVNGPSVFFTDPSCGLQQNFRTDAQLGEYVWRWDVRSGSVQVAADGFVQVLLSNYPPCALYKHAALKFRPAWAWSRIEHC